MKKNHISTAESVLKTHSALFEKGILSGKHIRENYFSSRSSYERGMRLLAKYRYVKRITFTKKTRKEYPLVPAFRKFLNTHDRIYFMYYESFPDTKSIIAHFKHEARAKHQGRPR